MQLRSRRNVGSSACSPNRSIARDRLHAQVGTLQTLSQPCLHANRACAPADLGGKGPRNTEADFSGLVARVMPNAGRRADQGRNVHEGTAAEDTKVFFAVFRPGASIGRCGVIVDVIAVFDPLPYVAMHVVEAEGVWLERADRRSLLLVPLTTAAVAICAVRADFVTPGIISPAVRPRRILPFRLG